MATITHPPDVEPDRSPEAIPESDDSLYEIINGERREIEPMGAVQAVLASILAESAGPFARRNRIGIFVTEVLFVLDAEQRLQRRPDAALIPYAKWPEASIPSSNAWNVIPDWTVEVVSSTNFAEEIETRIIDFFTAGVRLAWVIFPATQRVYVYTGPKALRVFDRGDELDGGEVLPGWRLPAAELFDAVIRPEGLGAG